ncbi:hypothetical protein K431DRAFT_287969 [Polychaeton citri CBS 116435]|uniref:Zn(2)-C6 fungal-type domain-containing protein n=1 Tax=Polychaeton citri CBS 116435 TaxID=1314669 RepID=A0A9P4Q4Z5_9PEZI|nr:hypothetical protein K431DRAFT_287969 [Polychaeton citri CBS 116435]
MVEQHSLRRASRPKVRSGCVTCKKRRVKCDEVKPACGRCLRADLTCGGYLAIPPRAKKNKTNVHTSSSTSSIKPILPRPALARLVTYVPGTVCRRLDHAEGIYYDMFRNRAALDLDSNTDTGFWCRHVLQSCSQDEAVLHGTLAIGALLRSLVFSTEGGGIIGEDAGRVMPLHPGERLHLDHHHKSALAHHSQAILALRRRVGMMKTVDEAKSITLMTLLLTTFELLRGNLSAADAVMKYGIKLSIGQGSPHITGIGELEVSLQCLSILSGYTRFCKSQLDIFRFMRNHDTSELSASLDDPTLALAAKWRKTFLWCMIFYTRCLEQFPFGNMRCKGSKGEQSKLMSHLAEWRQSILVRKTQLKHNHSQELDIIMIQILVCSVLVGCSLDPSELSFDVFIVEFEDIVRLCMQYIQENAATIYHAHFAFNGGTLTSSVSLVASKCRYYHIRMRAVELFKKMNYREGAWDRRALICNLGQVALEEAGRTIDGHIAPASRWIWTGATWEDSSNLVSAEYTRVLPDEHGVQVQKHVTLDVEIWPL